MHRQIRCNKRLKHSENAWYTTKAHCTAYSRFSFISVANIPLVFFVASKGTYSSIITYGRADERISIDFQG